MLSSTRWILLVLLGGVCATGCERTAIGVRIRDAARPEGGRAADAVAEVEADAVTADAASQPTYSGVILGKRIQTGATVAYTARALFVARPRVPIGGCAPCCCGRTERGLPFPQKPPDAGKVTIASASGTTPVATLVPGLFQGESGVRYGMSDLGWAWFAPLSDYASVDSLPWAPGEALQVLAAGNEVGAFAGVLQAGPDLGGIAPAIGTSPVVVDHDQAFEISWTPQGTGDAIVLLSLGHTGGACYCDGRDAAGKLVVDPGLLNPTTAEQKGTIELARLTVSTVASSNATVDLVGAFAQAGQLVVR
jgi:hypothetical protein